jgi:hypothetical protein
MRKGDSMVSYRRVCLLLSFLLPVCFCLISCSKAADKEKVGQVVVVEVEYSVRQTHGTAGNEGAEGTKGTWGNSFVVDARGKVKNIGDVDVKKVVVTGYCRSCTLAFTSQQWFTSDCDKTDDQQDIISYLAVGAEKEFSFEEIAFYISHEAVPPPLPEKMDIVIESFDVVELD